MRSCREISELVSQGMDKKLSLVETLAIRFHVMMCSHCRNFMHQTRFMRKAAEHYSEYLQSRMNKKS